LQRLPGGGACWRTAARGKPCSFQGAILSLNHWRVFWKPSLVAS
jgi:hypothetical protein